MSDSFVQLDFKSLNAFLSLIMACKKHFETELTFAISQQRVQHHSGKKKGYNITVARSCYSRN